MTEAPWLYAFVLFISALGGGIIFLLTKKQSGTGLKLLLSFSAAYLLGLALLHLFPDLFAADIPNAGYYVLAGFMLQVILDFFSHGVEHGHAHTHRHAGSRFFFTVMASLWIHAFIEGMPFGAPYEGHGHDHGHEGMVHDHRSTLLLGISLHKITEALVFTALLVNSGWKKARAFFWLVVFALIAPAGALCHFLLHESEWSGVEDLAPRVTGVLIGILLHVSTTIIFESEEGHRFNWMKFLSIIVGIGLAALMNV